MISILTSDEAVRLIPNGATVAVNPLPIEDVFSAFGRVFEATGAPNGLTIVWTAGIGPFSEERKGMNHFAYPGMVKRLIGGHYGLNHLLGKMVALEQVEAYNLPQGAISQLYREIAAKRTGLITKVGLGTFVDPRQDGGKVNERTKSSEDLVELIQIGKQELLRYKTFQLDIGIIRGTSVDPQGNLTNEDDAFSMEALELAMAVKNCGGKVIAQVARLLDEPANPHHVCVPGIFIDYVVVASSKELHPHTLFVQEDPSYTGKVRASLDAEFRPVPLCAEKVICRRAAMELRPDTNVNLGVGIPMGVAGVAFEEGMLHRITFNTEVGAIGGLPEGGRNFGPAKNPTAFMSQAQMFDFYDGGGLDLACIGLAQADVNGNVNVSKLGPRLIGCGGFINITQSSKECIFCGEFRAGGLDVAVENGAVVIRREGKTSKFLHAVQQITFSGEFARTQGLRILFVTERCVFRLTPDGLLLSEVAPGIDIERDIVGQMEFKPIVPADVPLMDPRIFRDEAMGISAEFFGSAH
ncbi:MAG: acyl CoA:acetate/3-ketoacid CoA transferase [Candidatus Hydrogenedentes bacterium]|nr:acyl CoA:acetate/3-ketoacid CoA transferase [Candidatus Hydrogenedentota bacterium]